MKRLKIEQVKQDEDVPVVDKTYLKEKTKAKTKKPITVTVEKAVEEVKPPAPVQKLEPLIYPWEVAGLRVQEAAAAPVQELEPLVYPQDTYQQQQQEQQFVQPVHLQPVQLSMQELQILANLRPFLGGGHPPAPRNFEPIDPPGQHYAPLGV